MFTASLRTLSALSQQHLSSLSKVSRQYLNTSTVSQHSLSRLLLSASLFTSLYSEHTSSNRRSTKYFVLFFWYGDKMFLKPTRYKLYNTTQVRKNMQLQACFLRTLLIKNRLPTSFDFKIYFMYWILKL